MIIDDVSPLRTLTKEERAKIMAWYEEVRYEEVRKSRLVHIFQMDFGPRDEHMAFLDGDRDE